MAYNRVGDCLGQTVSGITTTFEYDRLGRIQRRYTAHSYSDCLYEGNTDWLLRETWHSSISSAVFDLVRYWYTNGRPSRVEVASAAPDLSSVSSYTPYYLQYNWHGDVVTWVAADGNGSNTIKATTDPWGGEWRWGAGVLYLE